MPDGSDDEDDAAAAQGWIYEFGWVTFDWNESEVGKLCQHVPAKTENTLMIVLIFQEHPHNSSSWVFFRLANNSFSKMASLLTVSARPNSGTLACF